MWHCRCRGVAFFTNQQIKAPPQMRGNFKDHPTKHEGQPHLDRGQLNPPGKRTTKGRGNHTQTKGQPKAPLPQTKGNLRGNHTQDKGQPYPG